MSNLSPMILGLGAFEIGAIITICYYLSQLVGSPDNNNELSKTVVPISAGLGAVIMVHTLLWYMYFQYEPMAISLYLLISVSMCMIFSLTALAISLCQRS
uniref:Uncharacterized protein n=1 Tax=viral metagenome TaxID=1070528 RepID=A0A6C0AP89_9ZZZZ